MHFFLLVFLMRDSIMAQWLNNVTLDYFLIIFVKSCSADLRPVATFFLTISSHNIEETARPMRRSTQIYVLEPGGLSRALMILYDVFSVMNKILLIVHYNHGSVYIIILYFNIILLYAEHN